MILRKTLSNCGGGGGGNGGGVKVDASGKAENSAVSG